MSIKKNVLICVSIIAVPLFFLTSGLSEYFNFIPLDTILLYVFGFIMISILIYAIILHFFSSYSSLVLTNILQAEYMFFEDIRSFLLTINIHFFNKYSITLLFLFLFNVFFLVYFNKWNETTKEKFVNYLRVAFLLFSIYECIEIIINIDNQTEQKLAIQNINYQTLSVKEDKPDIYFIVLDEYPGLQTLSNNYNFNNTQFINDLRKVGFHIPDQSNSNYDLTSLSILSIFSLNYLSISDGVYNSVKNYSKAYNEIQNLYFFDFLKKNNYSIKNFSFFHVDDRESIAKPFFPVREHLLFSKTFGYRLINDVFNSYLPNSIQKFIGTSSARIFNYNKIVLDSLRANAHCKENVFVYAHLMMPHSPYLIDSSGNELNFKNVFRKLNAGKQHEYFIPYLVYTNKVVTNIVNKLLNNRKEKIVIIISDHGDRLSRINNRFSRFDNLIAVYPNNIFEGVKAEFITNVNIMRIILNHITKQKVPLIKNYKFTDHIGEL